MFIALEHHARRHYIGLSAPEVGSMVNAAIPRIRRPDDIRKPEPKFEICSEPGESFHIIAS